MHKQLNPIVLLLMLLAGLLVSGCTGGPTSTPAQKAKTVAILMGSNNRQALVDGLQAGMLELGYKESETIIYQIRNAGGDNSKLSTLAKEIVAAKPDLFVAVGGLEADAAKAATAGTALPVVFVGVSSSVDRGLVASLRESKNNLTGVDTAYTELAGKRLELLHQLLPEVKTVAAMNVPSITPSVESLKLVEEAAAGLGIKILVVEVEADGDFAAAAAEVVAGEADALLLFPVAPLQQALADKIYPVLSAQGIPIFGARSEDLKGGVFAFYGGQDSLMGRQAARIADKVLKGTPPTHIPVETPTDLKLTINQAVVKAIGLKLPEDALGLADQIVEIPPPGAK
jgi:putative ABC transport system substrate-binding protein